MTPVDEDALSVMKQAGQEFADKQYWRWVANEWKVPEAQEERKAHWRAVKDRIGEIVKEIKRKMKEEGK